MIHQLTSALLKDITAFLSREPKFFTLSSEEKQKKAPAMNAIIGEMSEETFLQDLKLTLKALKDASSLAESKLVQGIARYFLVDFPEIFDQLNEKFYASSLDAQKKRLDQLFSEQAHFYTVLKGALLLSSSQEIAEKIVQFLREMFESARIVVQSPVECAVETKKEIRAHFLKEHPQSFVDFSVNPQLIGGIRFFVDGKVQDHSWFGRIAGIRRLNNLVP